MRGLVCGNLGSRGGLTGVDGVKSPFWESMLFVCETKL